MKLRKFFCPFLNWTSRSTSLFLVVFPEINEPKRPILLIPKVLSLELFDWRRLIICCLFWIIVVIVAEWGVWGWWCVAGEPARRLLVGDLRLLVIGEVVGGGVIDKLGRVFRCLGE